MQLLKPPDTMTQDWYVKNQHEKLNTQLREEIEKNNDLSLTVKVQRGQLKKLIQTVVQFAQEELDIDASSTTILRRSPTTPKSSSFAGGSPFRSRNRFSGVAPTTPSGANDFGINTFSSFAHVREEIESEWERDLQHFNAVIGRIKKELKRSSSQSPERSGTRSGRKGNAPGARPGDERAD